MRCNFSAYHLRHNKSTLLLNSKVLVLNQNYEPATICSVRKAIILIYLNKAEMLDNVENKVIRSVNLAFPFPSVIRLNAFIQIPYKKVILSRKNILRRDGYKCQYCGISENDLTIDHIIPKAHGGKDSWENLVCACVRCNNKKGDKTPEESTMRLLKKPLRPNHVTFLRHYIGHLDERWKPYLFIY